MQKLIAVLAVAFIATAGTAWAQPKGPEESAASTCGVDVSVYQTLPPAPHRGNNDHAWQDFAIGRNPVVKGGIKACEPELRKLGFEVKVAAKGQVCGNMWGHGKAFFSRGCLPAGTRYAANGLVLVVLDCGNPMEQILREPPPACSPEKVCPPLPPAVQCPSCPGCPACPELPSAATPPKGKPFWCFRSWRHGLVCALPVGIGIGLAAHSGDDDGPVKSGGAGPQGNDIN